MEEIAEMSALFDEQRRDAVSQVERLLNDFEVHEAKEERAVEEYKKFLGSVKDVITRFVMQLIISDEEKHRAVTHAMIATLKGSLTWTKPEGSLESAGETSDSEGPLLRITDEFIRLEKEGIKEYKMLEKESADYYHGLFEILLSSIIRDSEKHVELLEFLRDRVKQK